MAVAKLQYKSSAKQIPKHLAWPYGLIIIFLSVFFLDVLSFLLTIFIEFCSFNIMWICVFCGGPDVKQPGKTPLTWQLWSNLWKGSVWIPDWLSDVEKQPLCSCSLDRQTQRGDKCVCAAGFQIQRGNITAKVHCFSSSPGFLCPHLMSCQWPKCQVHLWLSLCVVNWAEEKTDLGQVVPKSVCERSAVDDMSDVSEWTWRRGLRSGGVRVHYDKITAKGQGRTEPPHKYTLTYYYTNTFLHIYSDHRHTFLLTHKICNYFKPF